MLNKTSLLFRKINRHLKMFRDLFLIWTSDLFDEGWYLTNNPDVSRAKINPGLHYLHYGGFEGRDPGPKFSSNWYLTAYKDVKEARINPLVHYLRYGRAEGRGTGSGWREPEGYVNNSTRSTDKANKFSLIDSRKPKIFCIGFNKTGTTSIGQALTDFGFKLGSQSEAELLMDEWAVRDFRRIVRYCETADAFQDVPFSLDFTYQVLDYTFPGSKFILTVRSDVDEWYQSLIRFHSRLIGVNRVPTADDLKNFFYRDKGRLWRNAQYIFGVDEMQLYDQDIYKAHYTNHNNQVMEYFRCRPRDLLVLNLADSSAMKALCEFLGIKYNGQQMPHLNQSESNDVIR